MARATGTTTDPRGYSPSDHICWVFDDPERFHLDVAVFLAEGLSREERVWYAGDADRATLLEHLAPVGGIQRAVAEGQARVEPVRDSYRVSHVLDTDDQVRAWTEAAEQAVADGYTGLRVAVDLTSLTRTPEQLEAVCRYEQFVDERIARLPLTAMCGYDRRALAPDAAMQLACVHPVASKGATTFRLHAAAADAALGIGGEVDLAAADLFGRVLERSLFEDFGLYSDGIVIDVAELEFLDHRGMLNLAELAGRRDTTVMLRSAGPSVRRLVSLLGSDRVQLERAG